MSRDAGSRGSRQSGRRDPLKGSRGFTLVEVTVLIAVIGLLAGLVTSSAGEMLQKSKVLRSQDEVEEIGRAIAGFYADNGFFPRTADTSAGRPGGELLGTLVGEAALPETTSASESWIGSRADLLASHLTANDRGYRPRSTLGALGWSGPYLGAGIGRDPWGHAYLVNVYYLDARSVVQEPDGTPLGAVFALSAGPNGVIETPYFQPREAAAVYGDDIAFRLQ